jgi:hypothetical protein
LKGSPIGQVERKGTTDARGIVNPA